MSTQQPTRVEGGQRTQRLEFAREASLGSLDASPTFHEYSITPQSFSWTPEAEPQGRRALGESNVITWEQGPEIHDIVVVYDLVRWFTSGGDPDDAAYDAIFRGDDGLMDSHTVVQREEKGLLQPINTVNESEARATRIYSVGRGAVPASVEVQGDPSNAYPVQIELSYRAQRTRSFQIDQPLDGEALQVVSTDAADTTQNVTVETEGGTVSETVALNGTTPVPVGIAGDFDPAAGGVDALELDAETAGDVILQTDDPTDLALIRGTANYNDLEGDLGVPALNGGSRDPAPDVRPETFIGARIDRGGVEVPHEIFAATLRVTNELEERERATARAMGVYAANQDIEMDLSMYGENTSHDAFDQYLRTVEDNIEWYLPSGTVTVGEAVYGEPGERVLETEQAIMDIESTFRGQSVSIAEA